MVGDVRLIGSLRLDGLMSMGQKLWKLDDISLTARIGYGCGTTQRNMQLMEFIGPVLRGRAQKTLRLPIGQVKVVY